MTIKYLDSKRLEGVAGDLTATPVIGVGGWKEVGRTTLGSTTKPITVSSIPDKRYYMILVDMNKSGNATTQFRYGNSTIDTGSNYADRGSYNGVVDGTPRTSASTHEMATANAGVGDFIVGYVANLSAKEKLMQYHWVYNSTNGSGTAPERAEKVGKWTNGGVSAVIDTMQLYNSQSGNYLSGSEVVVLGWDPTDTHTTNFWEELASVNGSGSNTLSSGTITSKKYLWLQFYLDPSASYTPKVNFNGDTGSNYNNKYNINGGTDASDGAESGYYSGFGGGVPQFSNMFIINNSANEKLAMNHMVYQNTAGAGNAPERAESVGKWANTSSQITSIDITGGSATLSTSSFMKVWGSD